MLHAPRDGLCSSSSRSRGRSRAVRCRALLSWFQKSRTTEPQEKPAFNKREMMRLGPLEVSPMVRCYGLHASSHALNLTLSLPKGFGHLVLGQPALVGVRRESGSGAPAALQPSRIQRHQPFRHGRLVWDGKAERQVCAWISISVETQCASYASGASSCLASS